MDVTFIIFNDKRSDIIKIYTINYSTNKSFLIKFSQQTLACSILTALLSEFSSSSKTSNIGLSMEFHGNCKLIFQVSMCFCVSKNNMNRERSMTLQTYGRE